MSTTQVTKREADRNGGFLDRMPEVNLPQTPPTRVRTLVVWLFVLGFGVFGSLASWAALAPIRSAVVASGSFKVKGDRLVVEHLEGGIVREIRVQEGDLVEEGQVIAVLASTQADASIAILEAQLASALARQSRLNAELVQADDIELNPELAALIARSPELEDLFNSQREIFRTNLEMMSGQTAIIEGRVAQFKEQLKGLETRHKALTERLRIVRSEGADLAALLEQGLTTRSRINRRLEDENNLMGDLGALESDQQNAYQRIGEMQERVLQLRRDWLQQIAEDKDEVHGAIIDIRERLSATRDVLARQTIRAPRAGRIVSLDINTIGGVINRGQGILEIVPQDATYILETRVKPSDIDEVILNGTAQVRLTAYSFRTTPPIKGRVVYVSADSLIAPENGQPYYQVDIKIDPGEFEALPGVHMIPGMPAQAMLQTGEQTIVEYLINPMIGSLETALRENK